MNTPVVRLPASGLRACRVCGCTEFNACIDEAGIACHWVEANLCSCCVGIREDEDAPATLFVEGRPRMPLRKRLALSALGTASMISAVVLSMSVPL